jgi:hypothetical protein
MSQHGRQTTDEALTGLLSGGERKDSNNMGPATDATRTRMGPCPYPLEHTGTAASSFAACRRAQLRKVAGAHFNVDITRALTLPHPGIASMTVQQEARSHTWPTTIDITR